MRAHLFVRAMVVITAALSLYACSDTQFHQTTEKPDKILAQTTYGSKACRLPWGGFLENGDQVEAFSEQALECGISCSERMQLRICQDGILSGSDDYKYPSCGEVGCPSCTFNTRDKTNIVLEHGQEMSLFSTSGPLSCSDSCGNYQTQIRCERGELIGIDSTEFSYTSCSYEPCPCELPYAEDGPQAECNNSTTCAHGTTLRFYRAQQYCGSCDETSQSIERTCQSGRWVNTDFGEDDQRQFVFRTCESNICADCTHPDPAQNGRVIPNGNSETFFLSRDRVCVQDDLTHYADLIANYPPNNNGDPYYGDLICSAESAIRSCHDGILSRTNEDGESLEAYVFSTCDFTIPETGCLDQPPPSAMLDSGGGGGNSFTALGDPPPSGDDGAGSGGGGDNTPAGGSPSNDCSDHYPGTLTTGCGINANSPLAHLNLNFSTQSIQEVFILAFDGDENPYTCGPYSRFPDHTVEVMCGLSGVKAFLKSTCEELPYLANPLPNPQSDASNWTTIANFNLNQYTDCDCSFGGRIIHECSASDDPATCEKLTTWSQPHSPSCNTSSVSCDDFQAQFICQFNQNLGQTEFVAYPFNSDITLEDFSEPSCTPDASCNCYYNGQSYALQSEGGLPLHLYDRANGSCAESCDSHSVEFYCVEGPDGNPRFETANGDTLDLFQDLFPVNECIDLTTCTCDLPSGFQDIDYLHSTGSDLEFDAVSTHNASCLETCDDYTHRFRCELNGDNAVHVVPLEPDSANWNSGAGWYPVNQCSIDPTCSCTAWADPNDGRDAVTRVYNPTQPGSASSLLEVRDRSDGDCVETCNDGKVNFRCQPNDDNSGVEFRKEDDLSPFIDSLWYPADADHCQQSSCVCNLLDGHQIAPPQNTSGQNLQPNGTTASCDSSCPPETILWCVVDPMDPYQVVLARNQTPSVGDIVNWNPVEWQTGCTADSCACTAFAGTADQQVISRGGIIQATQRLLGTCDFDNQGSCDQAVVSFTCQVVPGTTDQVAFYASGSSNPTVLSNSNGWHPANQCDQPSCNCDPFNELTNDTDPDHNSVTSVGGSFMVSTGATGDCHLSCEAQQQTLYCVLDPSNPRNVLVSDRADQPPSSGFDWNSIMSSYYQFCSPTACVCSTPWGQDYELGQTFNAIPQNYGTCEYACIPENRTSFQCVQDGDNVHIAPAATWNDGVNWKSYDTCQQPNNCHCDTNFQDAAHTVSIGNFTASPQAHNNCDGSQTCGSITKSFKCSYVNGSLPQILPLSGVAWDPDIFQYRYCRTNTSCSCGLPWGQTLAVNQTKIAYNTAQVDCGLVCDTPATAITMLCQPEGETAQLVDAANPDNLIPPDTEFSYSTCFPKTDCAGTGGGEHGGDGDGQGLGSYGDEAGGPGGGGDGGPGGGGCRDLSDAELNSFSVNEVLDILNSTPPGVQLNFARSTLCQLPPQFSRRPENLPEIFDIGGSIAPGVRLSAFTKDKVCEGTGTCEQYRVSLYCDYDGELYYPPQITDPNLIYPGCRFIKEDDPDYDGECL